MERVRSASPWEERYGFCRAVKAGGWVYTAGTAPIAPDGTTHAPGDGYAQATRCYEIIARAIEELGGDRTSVVRSRMYVTEIGREEEFGTAHRDFFAGHVPGLTMVEVKSLVDPAMLVEIEAEAWVG